MKPLLLDVSLWSADLANLAGSIARANEWVDSYHLDVSDGHFAPSLLFFPDLVAAIRPLTTKPFHVHLLTQRPGDWVNAFAEAGANRIYVHERSRRLMEQIRSRGCEPGLAIALDQPLTFMEGCESILLMATAVGIKGVGPARAAFARIRAMSRHLESLGNRGEVGIVVDGGVRKDTVPAYREAGADGIVPGSLFFGAEDPSAITAWLRSL